MNIKTRRFLPLAIAAILALCLGAGIWTWYDNNVDRSGWAEKKGVRYYRDFHADPVSGWLELAEGTFYFHADGTPHFGWQEIDGIPYYFDDTGAMHTGWLHEDGKVHYFGGNGTMVVGWLWLEEDHYYLQDGALLTGWQDIEGQRYYFQETGIAASGFAEIDGETYYFADCVMSTGLTETENGFYYFNPDGTMHTGWLESQEGRRYFHPEGAMATGWQEIEGRHLYFADGILATGETEIDGHRYFFQEDGSIYSGWLETDGGKRYFDNGAMAVGWTYAEGAKRYFDENGFMVTGWLQDGEYRYNLRADGTPTTGPALIGGEMHYFSPKGIEVILVNAINPVPAYYNRELVNVVDNHDVDKRCYEALTQMLADCEEAGIEYTFNSAYRTQTEQITILEYRTLEHMRDYGMTFQEAREKALDTVAIPGTSEHHLGLAVDLLGKEAIAWLTEHCWDYGFIVRYTEAKEDITGIVDEPWHFRYVGKEVSLDMKDSGLCLEEYLGAEAVSDYRIEEIHGDAWSEEKFTMMSEETIKQYLPDYKK